MREDWDCFLLCETFQNRFKLYVEERRSSAETATFVMKFFWVYLNIFMCVSYNLIVIDVDKCVGSLILVNTQNCLFCSLGFQRVVFGIC